MSEPESVDSGKSRVRSVIDSVNKMMSEDPLIAGFFLAIVVPLTYLGMQSAITLNIEVAFICFLLLGLSVFIVFIPLLIVKTKRTDSSKLRTLRESILEDERERRQKSWELTQERANKVIDAKIENLQAQTNYLHDQSERFEKYLIHESAKEIGENIEARFQSMELVDKATFGETVKAVLDSFKNIDEKYDHIINSFSVFKASLDLIAKEQALEKDTTPDIHVEKEVKDPIETPPDSIPEEIFEEPETPISEPLEKVQVDSPISPILKVTDSALQKELTEDVSALEEALNVVDKLEEPTESPGEKDKWETGPPSVEPVMKPLPPNTWRCPKCEKVLSNKRVRCPTCGSGKGID